MPSVVQFSPLVRLKAGADKAPILIAHGMSGTVQVGELARHIRTERPIYGIQAKGLDGLEKPLDRVEDMAKFYLDALRISGLAGPYILMGYSFGGLVALEMAHRLSTMGTPPAMLIMVDAYPHPRFMATAERLHLWGNRIRRHTNLMRSLPTAAAMAYAMGLLKHRWWHIKSSSDIEEAAPTGVPFGQPVLQRVKECAYSAYRHYRPKFYAGKVTFITTSVKSCFPENPESIWGHLADELEVAVIPGDHLNIVTTHFIGLASLLTTCIEHSTAYAKDLT